ncbi:nucleoside-diphosphate-sugar epimerase [Paenibacillus polymyxa]|uniref:NAD-dependent epimerase/dehydratase family protein n=1 Tax=Paenibacillus polymyxa TaxID=1406 RepID=UPI0027902C4A|nr:NAD(P)-dependent oxidoreductase [Paenibacillus polymyxa]MDQ0048941.1 nucleoside-diphosphate-sugar epimerase [Paenibacillus polymyxa]
METAVLTGGTGFLGFGLLSELVTNGVFVYVVVRENSKRLTRLQGISGIEIIELNMDDISKLASYVKNVDVFYHLAWEGERNDYSTQMKNIETTVRAMQVARQIGAEQFIVTGSQAEYGICKEEIDENTSTNPNTAYGACKLACYQILCCLAEQISISLTWVRVFSVYGEGDNPNTLISYLFRCFREEQTPQLTRGNQYWDFLYLNDAANALYLFGEKNKSGLYNLASGYSRSLKEFIIEARNMINPEITLKFSAEKTSAVELRANIKKIRKELEWQPRVNFKDGISKLIQSSL